MVLKRQDVKRDNHFTWSCHVSRLHVLQVVRWSGPGRHLDEAGLFFTEGKRVAAETELDRITQRCPANDLDGRTVAEAHLQQPATHVRVAPDGDDTSAAPDAQVVQATGIYRAGVV